MSYRAHKYIYALVTILTMVSCSVYKYVPEGEYLLHKVTIEASDPQLENISQYRNMAYQSPNTKWLGLFRIPLRIYSMSADNSRKKDHQGFFQRIGEEPVILDTVLCEQSVENIRRALVNDGYLKAGVESRIKYSRRPKADVVYVLHPDEPYYVDSYETDISDNRIDSLINDNPRARREELIYTGMPLDADILDKERSRIVSLLKTQGYYSFNKEDISFVADTVEGSTAAGLTMRIRPFSLNNGDTIQYPTYTISSVSYIFSDNGLVADDSLNRYRRVEVDGNDFYFIDTEGNGKLKLRPGIVGSHSYLREGTLYNSNMVSRTYNSLSRLSPVRNTNIVFNENITDRTLDAKVVISSNQKRSFAAQLEGTNTAGDFGAAASLSLTNRNLFGGAERLTMTLRGAFEAITNLPGYGGNSYREYGIEANLEFPELLLPFVNQDFQRRSQATSQLSLMLNSQRRPEFNKSVMTFGWSYLWSYRRHTHRFDAIDVDYLIVPWISDKFRKEYLDPIGNRNSILRYNYEDMLITKLGYSYYFSNAGVNSGRRMNVSLRLSAETSGNLLYGICSASDAGRNNHGQYKALGIAFAQYVRSDGAFTLNWKIDKWNNLIFHTEYGVAYPYANSTSIPFEKRFYAGGANSVRGWAVRELGPGNLSGGTSAVNYITQAGDIKMLASLELRAHMFWKLNAAFFVDAGNIWTIRDYEEQPGGLFTWNTFYNQIGVSFGYGLRLDLSFLVLRLDFGRQLVNPAYDSGPERYPAYRDVGYRNYAFHFAVGYPF